MSNDSTKTLVTLLTTEERNILHLRLVEQAGFEPTTSNEKKLMNLLITATHVGACWLNRYADAMEEQKTWLRQLNQRLGQKLT